MYAINIVSWHQRNNCRQCPYSVGQGNQPRIALLYGDVSNPSYPIPSRLAVLVIGCNFYFFVANFVEKLDLHPKCGGAAPPRRDCPNL
ncbi:hypothetical protein BDN67DRAFT_168709 [Paxillus ammoniavirescens]|nr:hypothetical protein BDN67DRAFT_168709 [Paxillus ammoniavirescens]